LVRLLRRCLELNLFQEFGFLYFLALLSMFKRAQGTPLPSTRAERKTLLVKFGVFSTCFSLDQHFAAAVRERSPTAKASENQAWEPSIVSFPQGKEIKFSLSEPYLKTILQC